MIREILLDTGPLVALVNRHDRYHTWARTQVAGLNPPLLTCEAVLTEACYLLRNFSDGVQAVLAMFKRGLVIVPFRLNEEAEWVAKLLARYINIPMSLADACLVRMAEQHKQSAVMTLDSDFRIYRKYERQLIPTIMPDYIDSE